MEVIDYKPTGGCISRDLLNPMNIVGVARR